MFISDPLIPLMAAHGSSRFKVIVGFNPLGDFSAVEGLGYEQGEYTYKEMGRNHAPVRLPFGETGKPTNLTLRWGLVYYNKLYDWMKSVEIGGDFYRDVFIFQLSKMGLPMRCYMLTACWPTRWTASQIDASGGELPVEEVELVYDQIHMVNLSLVAFLGELLQLTIGSGSGLGDWNAEAGTRNLGGSAVLGEEDGTFTYEHERRVLEDIEREALEDLNRRELGEGEGLDLAVLERRELSDGNKLSNWFVEKGPRDLGGTTNFFEGEGQGLGPVQWTATSEYAAVAATSGGTATDLDYQASVGIWGDAVPIAETYEPMPFVWGDWL